MKKIFYAIVVVACLAGGVLADEIFTVYGFHKAISGDASAAREKYAEKPVIIRGTVARTYISRYLTPCVELVGDAPKVTFVLPYGGITRGAGQLSDFKEGQDVIMTGVIRAINDEIVVIKEGRIWEK